MIHWQGKTKKLGLLYLIPIATALVASSEISADNFLSSLSWLGIPWINSTYRIHFTYLTLLFLTIFGSTNGLKLVTSKYAVTAIFTSVGITLLSIF
jgi:hypothetical protein